MSALARYESFLINNVSTISSLESSLRSITWFLPGRFKDAELASEAREFELPSVNPRFYFLTHFLLVSALLNVMSMYHDTLLARFIKSNPNYRPILPPSLHSRFTRTWSERNIHYKWAARALELIKFIELVVEMGLRRKVSSKSRWRSIILLEVLK